MKILEEAYKELEEKSIHEKYTHGLSTIFQNARDTLQKNLETEEAIKAQYEIDFLNFSINENTLSFLYSGTNQNGEPFEYPTLKEFTDEKYIYLIERQKDTKAENLKARYSHILWLSPKKKIDYAQKAIDNYLKLIKIREKQDKDFPKGFFGLEVLTNIKNAFLLSISTSYKVEKTKNEVIKLVKNYSDKSNSSFVIRFQLVELMLEHKKTFRKDDFKGIVPICEQIVSKAYESSKHKTIDILNLIIKVEKKLKNETIDYDRRIAKLWEELSYEREDETNIVSTEFCKNAINIYKKIKDTAKVKELEKRFDKLRKNIKLAKIGQEFDATEMIQGFRKYANSLTDNEPFAIIHNLMTDKKLLPAYEEVEEQAKETSKQRILSLIGNTSVLDQKGNTAQHFSTKEENEYHSLLQAYQFSLQLSKSHLIREIIFSGIKKGKLNANHFLSFLQEYSWLGKELEMSTHRGKNIPYCWLALIAPALNVYFANLEFHFRSQKNYPNFILCIDSLSLKIEGMLRDICEFQGITTYEFRKDKKGRTISQEKDIHKLLYEPQISALIDKDDLLFFKFLLVEKAGYNLRHRVAHSLMTFNDYHIDHINLLIMAILKFGKYNFVPKNKE